MINFFQKPLKHIIIEDIGTSESTNPPHETTLPSITSTQPSTENVHANRLVEEIGDVPDTHHAASLRNVTLVPSETADRECGGDQSLHTKMSVSDVAFSGNQKVEAEVCSKLELLPVPQSSIVFQADWKRLRRNRSLLTQYFKVCIYLVRGGVGLLVSWRREGGRED